MRVSRSPGAKEIGAAAGAEVAAAGKPAIFVPFPRAADDHQRRNAEALAVRGAALLLPEAELNPERLVATVESLLQDHAGLQRMGEAARALSHPHAAREIAELVVRVAGGSKSEPPAKRLERHSAGA